MLTKNTITFLRSLHEREWRKLARAFLVEGEKNIVEFLASDFVFLEGYFTEGFLAEHEKKLSWKATYTATEWEIDRISTLKSNSVWVAVFRMKDDREISKKGIILVLDDINDPGNLGTIIRTADWYGVTHIVASEHTVDVYNPKVIMASMGSFSRVNVTYENLAEYFKWVEWPVYGAYLEGEDMHTITVLPTDLHLVIGSESHGISSSLKSYISHPITIPRAGAAESLNAWVATAVILDNMRRVGD